MNKNITHYRYEIAPNSSELGAGWTLHFRDDLGEVASGIFYVDRSSPDQLAAGREGYENAEKFALAWIADKRLFEA